MLLAVIGGGIFFAGAWVVAASGLYEVPLFSGWAFHEPEPLHEVVLEEDYENVGVLERMRTEINELIRTHYPGQLRVSAASVSIEETLLSTYLYQNVSMAAGHADAEIEKAQVALEPQGMEIFVHMIHKGRPVYISFLVIPQVVDNDIYLDIQSARIGSLPIPSFAASFVLNTFLGSALSVLQIPAVGFVHLDSIDLLYGKLKLNGTIEYTTFE